MGPTPSFKAQAALDTIADPSRRSAVHSQQVAFTQVETEKLLQSMHLGIETSSFVGWHLATMVSRIKETIDRLPSLSAQDLRASLQEPLRFLQCMDRAQASSLRLQNVNLANVLLRKRQSFVNLCSPSVSAAECSDLL